MDEPTQTHETGGMPDDLYAATGELLRVQAAAADPTRPDSLLADLIQDSGWWAEVKRRSALYASGGGDPEWRERVRRRLAGEEQ